MWRMLLFMGLCVGLTLGVRAGDAGETQRQYLSGLDKDRTVDWEFFCTAGLRSNEWTTIPVPSCWEMQGFGAFNYGRDLRKDGLFYGRADEHGLYRHRFEVSREWENRRVDLVFEGVMTDAEVKLNGQSAGPVHQGGFYRFRYDVTDLLEFGAENLLEVDVAKMSADASINEAERAGDYWIYGGIYRPVYLESRPAEAIEHMAIAARADGSFSVGAELAGVKEADRLICALAGPDGETAAPFSSVKLEPGQTSATLSTRLDSPRLWSAETPELYTATLELRGGRRVLHRVSERFGFRTVEIREGEGIFLNGHRVMFKGSNRHVSWPDSARTVSRTVDELDVGLMKEMNMNAVRTSHYPPDESFLDVCDEQGLYVMDELAGWHWAYDTAPGRKLVREVVRRDVNHPCVLFWSNGNEGGTNMDLNEDFGLYDPQQRPVLIPTHHENEPYNGVDTQHYPVYARLQELLKGPNLCMPCEFLHGLYDGGGGSGLGDYWDAMRVSPYAAGGFLWAFVDEAIRRPDRYGQLDSHMSNAPDGLVGPYREKEGSFNAIREIWSPIVVTMDALPEDFDGAVPVENRYDMSSLARCRFEWALLDWGAPAERTSVERKIARGGITGPGIAPGQSGSVKLDLPHDWRSADGLTLAAFDWDGREVMRWTWPVKTAREWAGELFRPGEGSVECRESSRDLTLECPSLLVRIDRATGRLAEIKHEREGEGKVRPIDLANGPTLDVAGSRLIRIEHYAQPGAHVIEARYQGAMRLVIWKLHASGWLELRYAYRFEGGCDCLGVSFDYPERKVAALRWLGGGPYRVWKNRLEGARFGLWEKGHNTTVTGRSSWIYPEFRGYHSRVYWAMLETTQGWMTIVNPSGDGYLRLFSPTPMPGERIAPAFPSGSISWMDAIPPVDQKFIDAYTEDGPVFGPASARPEGRGDYARTLYFYFGVE